MGWLVLIVGKNTIDRSLGECKGFVNLQTSNSDHPIWNFRKRYVLWSQSLYN